MADRLFIDKKYETAVIDKIDAEKILGLNFPDCERMDLFLFAMSLGVNAGYRTPLNAKKGLILETALNNRPEAKAAIYSLSIEELRKMNQEDKLDDKDFAFQVAEEYANTGFGIMEKWFSGHVPNVYQFIKEMDDRYEQLFEE